MLVIVLSVLTGTSILVRVLELSATPQVATVLLFLAVNTHDNSTRAARNSKTRLFEVY